MKSHYKSFHYYPVEFEKNYTKKPIRGFKFPSNDKVFREGDEADRENLQQFQIYFGVNEVMSSLEDIMRTGTKKTNKLYNTLIETLKDDYNKVSVTSFELASSMCWFLHMGQMRSPTTRFTHKLTPERAIYEIEPAIKGMLLAVQTKMDLTFPISLFKNIARLEIEKEIIDLKKATGNIKKTVSKHEEASFLFYGFRLSIQVYFFVSACMSSTSKPGICFSTLEILSTVSLIGKFSTMMSLNSFCILAQTLLAILIASSGLIRIVTLSRKDLEELEEVFKKLQDPKSHDDFMDVIKKQKSSKSFYTR